MQKMHRKIGHILVLGFLGRKSGGDIAYAVPPTLKSGGARPPRPPPIDAHEQATIDYNSNVVTRVGMHELYFIGTYTWLRAATILTPISQVSIILITRRRNCKIDTANFLKVRCHSSVVGAVRPLSSNETQGRLVRPPWQRYGIHNHRCRVSTKKGC